MDSLHKKFLVGKGHSIPNFIHIFRLIVPIRISFTAAEDSLCPRWLNSLSWLGLPLKTIAENRNLSIELAGLVDHLERQRQNEMKVVSDNDVSNRNSDGHNHGSITVDPNVLGMDPVFANNPIKRVKVELTWCQGGVSSMSNAETIGSTGHPDNEFKSNASMEERMIEIFSIRPEVSSLYSSIC